MRPRVIAFYLPQYYPTETNDKYWGKGFTEWSNVCKARPLFRGHYQPHIPADLGFYDLRLKETRLAQAEMAKEYGIEGFCYYHYWFGNDRRELERPFQEVLESGEPDFPFMLCWANESWHKKFWNKDGVFSKKLIVEQQYNGIDDYTNYFYSLLPAFKDSRYMKVENKPMFMIYKPLDFPDFNIFIELWKKLAKNNGFDGFYFIGQSTDYEEDGELIFNKGFDSINTVRLDDIHKRRNHILRGFYKLYRTIFNVPLCYNYSKVKDYFITEIEKQENVIPTIIPNYDHTPRSGRNGYVYINSTPELFGKSVKYAIEAIKNKPQNKQIIFIKSWNEWGEGNYLEPDLIWKDKYLLEIKKLILAN
jgi:hypothetical protein